VRQALPFGNGAGSSQGGASAQEPAVQEQPRSSGQDNRSLYQQVMEGTVFGQPKELQSDSGGTIVFPLLRGALGGPNG
jgi:hypothetical protein